ncbi:FAD-binding protein, partial [Bacteroidales bacterium OttesenSCG-928-B11]|nr:FAD-binding protein [Bacteroidales bacterium OttesenSCG-928-B11]
MKKITDISLKTYNTFAIDCKAHNMLVLENEDDIVNFVHLKDKYSPFYILAGGSNVLFTSDFEGTILLIRNKGIRVIEENGDNITIEVSAGESWEEFVNYCVKNSYFGVENLAGIPGLVGSSPVQNIGAYGMEVKDTITAVDGYFIDSGKKSTFLHAA